MSGGRSSGRFLRHLFPRPDNSKLRNCGLLVILGRSPQNALPHPKKVAPSRVTYRVCSRSQISTRPMHIRRNVCNQIGCAPCIVRAQPVSSARSLLRYPDLFGKMRKNTAKQPKKKSHRRYASSSRISFSFAVSQPTSDTDHSLKGLRKNE